MYQRIAPKALQLRELGLTDAAIARHLGVSDKTVAKATLWIRETSSGREVAGAIR
jgi:orotate phosphoribosyltransferase-like protein